MNHQQYQFRASLIAQIQEFDSTATISFANPEHVVGLGEHADAQVKHYFETCIIEGEFIIANLDLYSYDRLNKANKNGDFMTVAHNSGYIEFAQYDADGDRFYVNPFSGKIFLLGLGVDDEDGIYGQDVEKNSGYLETDRVDDCNMRKASTQHWGSFLDFFAQDITEIGLHE